MIQGKILLIYVLMLSSVVFGYASDNNPEGHKEFNTVEYIFEHVNDSHEWYFATIGDKNISIPLPIILYSSHSGWHLFMSNKLYHNEVTDHDFNFVIAEHGSNSGKIVEILENGEEFVPLDLSITKTVSGMMLISVLIILVFIRAGRKAKSDPFKIPGTLQNIAEPLVLFVKNEIAKPFIGDNYRRFLPFLLTMFTFILTANLIGLILPLGLNITGNIAVTMVLAAFTLIVTTINGNKHYWKHIVNPDVPVFMKFPIPLMPIIEFAGIFIKPMVLMIRLFANIFAGHIIVSVLVSLIFIMSTVLSPAVGAGTSVVSVAFSVFMVLLDLIVAVIQAYIFTLLSAVYFGMATDNGH